MALVLTKISFEGSPPTKDVLELKLSASTGIHVHIEIFSLEENPANISQASNVEHPQTWYIHFSSPPDKFESKVRCTCGGPNFEVRDSLESLDRCPHYLRYAIIATLVDLGGVVEEIDDLPDYARGTFENWKMLNGGSRPPAWKVALAALGMIAYAFLMILLSPILIIIMLFAFVFWRPKGKPA